MLTYADVCWRMLTYADVWAQMQAATAWTTGKNRLLCPYSPTGVISSQYTSLVSAMACFSSATEARGLVSAMACVSSAPKARGAPQRCGRAKLNLQHQPADVCWRMLTYADVYWRMLTYADVCWRMLTYADVWWRMLTYADVCWRTKTGNISLLVHTHLQV